MKKNFMKRVSAILLAMALLLVGCGNGDTSKNSNEKVLKCGATTGFFGAESLDPGYNWDGWIMSIYGISENLFRLDANFVPQPWLATSYEVVDELTWKFELRDDVKFSNGNKMTADAVKACFERTYGQNDRAMDTIPVKEIVAEGQTLTIITTKAVPTMINDLCDPLMAVYDASDVDETLGASCTGPFVATDFEAMVSVSMKKNVSYWGGEPKVDRVELSIIDDQSALNAALQNGDIDLIAQLDAASVDLFKDASKYTIDATTSTRTNFLMYNLEKNVVKDKAVRNAIGYCVDRDSFANVVYNGYATVSYGIYPDSVPFGGSKDYSLSVDGYNPEKAKEILAEAGYKDIDGDGVLEKDGEKLSLNLVTYSYNNATLQLSDMLFSELSKIGIEVNIETYDVLDETMENGDFDVAILSYAMSPIGTPSYFANMVFATGASNNYGHYSNASVDEKIEKINASFDMEEKTALAKEVNQSLLDDAAFDFIIHQQLICAYGNQVKGFEINPTEYYLVTNTIDVER